MSTKENSNIETWMQLLIGVIAIFALKSIFENDRSRIISKKGSNILSDKEKMKEINKQRGEMESEDNQQEIFI